MSDYLMREFGALLNTTMESVLRRAVFEIMKIFENSLHDHQLELARKGEEIVHLKVKLQRAEIKLRETNFAGDGGPEMDNSQTGEAQTEPEDPVNASGQISAVPEIDFEVPDDWCAPVGLETMTKPDDSVCPSVRLRPLSIPLWHIPIVKQEVANRDIDSHLQIKAVRRSKRVSSSNEKGKQTKDRSLPMHDQVAPCPRVRGDSKKLLQEDTEPTSSSSTGLRTRGKNSTGEEEENTPKRKKEDQEGEAVKSEPTEQERVDDESEKKYTCKFCKKVFDSQFGRNVHVRSHKRCKGCKKEFPFPSSLRCHKPHCTKFQKLIAKETQSSDASEPQPCEAKKNTKPIQNQGVTKKDGTPSPPNNSKSSIQRDQRTKLYHCGQCNRKCKSRFRLKEHMRIHTGEKPFTCTICSSKFRVSQSLKHHVMRMHTKGDLAWTKPLEETEENQEDLILPKKDTSASVNHNNAYKGRTLGWEAYGTQCPDGFTCKLCSKVRKTKYLLMEHYRIHTGEKPFKCLKCNVTYRFRGQLYVHRKICSQSTIQCEKCGKGFMKQEKYDKHMSTHHRDWPLSCKVCGKGFLVVGRLKNHMKRIH